MISDGHKNGRLSERAMSCDARVIVDQVGLGTNVVWPGCSGKLGWFCGKSRCFQKQLVTLFSQTSFREHRLRAVRCVDDRLCGKLDLVPAQRPQRRDRRAKHNAADACPQDRRHAHRTWLGSGIKRQSRPVYCLRSAVVDRDNFGMPQWIFGRAIHTF